ncbi:DUF2169 domain-containing protein [Pelistega sp. MC2]|uniref:DUF2169 domain-containing protein n=1 Tax=Pelistega sp. MC2 TaxID=1720297 RepID=UPI0008D8F774|nr:DUF2169 domain-containing protein [Pelistega sp. MC2]
MRVIKPLTQSLLHRKFDYDKKSFISIVGAVFFDFKTQTLCSEQDLWQHFGEECQQQFDVEILDIIGKKKTPEIVVNAYAYGKYAEGGKTLVQLKLNNVSKTLEIWGNRYWIDGKPSTPESFDKIPINWRNAYGGADFDKNPKGKGRDYMEIGEAQLRVKPLPNIEHPSYPIRSERDEPPPITLTALPVEYPDRNKLMGSYDERWRQEEFPGLAKDVDWSYFNQSPMDQRLAQLEVGDQATFIHMHPEKATCTMTIPPIVSKAFVRLVKEKDKQANFLHSVDLSLTTLWAFPHVEKAFLIYEGVLEIPRWFFVDDIVAELMGAIEHTERSKPLSYYEEIFRLRTDDKTSMHYASLDRQLVDEVFLPPSKRIPVGIALKQKLKRLIKDLRPIEQSYTDNQERIIELRKEGYEIEDFDVKSFLQENFGEDVQSLDDLEQWLDNGIDLEKENQKQLEGELQEKSVLTQVREARKEIKKAEKQREEANKDSLKMTRAEFIQAQKEQAKFVKEVRNELTNMPENLASAEKVLAELSKNKEMAKLFHGYTPEQFLAFQVSGNLLPERNFQILNSSASPNEVNEHYQTFAFYAEKKKKLLETMQGSSSMSMPADFFADEPINSSKSIDSLQFFLSGSDELSSDNLDFSLADHSAEDESYQGALIVELSVAKSQFIRCDFSHAQFINTHFKHCQFENCRFIGNQFEKSFFEYCQFRNCQFIGTEWEKCIFSTTEFKQCDIKTSDFDSGTYTQVVFEESQLEMCDFIRARLRQLRFIQSEIKQFGFTKGLLQDLSFDQSKIESMAIIVDSLIKKLDMSQCQMSKVFIKAGTRIRDLKLERCTDRESSWRELTIDNAFIFQSKMENNDFSKTTLNHASIKDTSFKDSMWMSSLLSHAKLNNVDFAEAVMMGFKSVECYFKHVSFFSAELSYIDIDSQTVFDDCYMERANTVPSLR